MAIAALIGVPAGVLLLVYAVFLNDGGDTSPLILWPIIVLIPLTLSIVLMGLVRGAQEQKGREASPKKRDRG